MIFESVVVGPLGVNCFILGCRESKAGVVVDPGADAERIIAKIGELGLDIRYVINTHGHFDHVGGNRWLVEATGAQLMIHRDDVHFLNRAADAAATYGLATENSPSPDLLLEDGQTIEFGSCRLEVFHTPGHTPGGCCLYLAGEKKVISGDTLFAESVGRTDFPGSSHRDLIDSIRAKLLTLPDDVQVFPGHGPATTIGRERRYNPYLND